MINGFEYSWEDINVVMMGRLLTGITAINYTTERDHMNIHGRGSEPVAMGRGKKNFQASITLLQSEIEAIQALLPKGKDLTDIAPFRITASFSPEGGVITTDEIGYARISGIPKGMKTGDPNMEVTLPLVIGKIKYNV